MWQINVLDVIPAEWSNMKNTNNNNMTMNGVTALRGAMLSDIFEIAAMNDIDNAMIYLNFGDHVDIMTYWAFFKWFELHTNMYGFVDALSVHVDADGTANIAIEMHDTENVDELA